MRWLYLIGLAGIVGTLIADIWYEIDYSVAAAGSPSPARRTQLCSDLAHRPGVNDERFGHHLRVGVAVGIAVVGDASDLEPNRGDHATNPVGRNWKI